MPVSTAGGFVANALGYSWGSVAHQKPAPPGAFMTLRREAITISGTMFRAIQVNTDGDFAANASGCSSRGGPGLALALWVEVTTLPRAATTLSQIMLQTDSMPGDSAASATDYSSLDVAR